ncbi:MAG: hypothetical protein FWF82_02695 [Oscillospiraceae bacterium]|nr:hypothetical protein [Oscillospiraceae bacterium]
MNKTENLKLNLPSPDNFADIADLNENFTIIEDSINSINVKTTQVGNSAEAAQTTANSAIANAATAQSAANTALANAAAAQSTANAKQNALDSTQMGNINNPPKGADLGNQGTTAFGQTVQNGAAATFARSDHRHAIPAAPAVPAAANLSSQAASFGQSARDGTAGTFARSAHYHGIPAAPAAANLGSQAQAFGQAARHGTAASFARSDHYHALPPRPVVAGIEVFTAAGTRQVNIGFKPKLLLLMANPSTYPNVYVDGYAFPTASWQGVTSVTFTDTGFTLVVASNIVGSPVRYIAIN